MAVSSATNRSPASGGYACNGSLTDFTGGFRILDEDHISVVLTDSDGNYETLTLTTDYTVSPTGGSYPCDTFTVTTVETYSSSYTITILRNVPATQLTNYGKTGPYLPNNHEASLDKLTMEVQQLKEELERCIKYGPAVDVSGVTITIDSDGSVILSYLQDDSVNTSNIADGAVTTAKLQNIATSTVLGRTTAGTGAVEQVAFSEITVLAAPSGTVSAFAGSSAPTGWLICDGSAVSRSTYADLFSAIGVAWGVGDGSTTFNLPDLRGRSMIGVGTGAGLTARALADTGGEETHQLTETEMPAHTHDIQTGIDETSSGKVTVGAGTGELTTDSTGGDGAHNNMQPFAALNFIIKA